MSSSLTTEECGRLLCAALGTEEVVCEMKGVSDAIGLCMGTALHAGTSEIGTTPPFEGTGEHE